MSVVSVLNDLITFAKDGEQGFFKVAEEIKDQKLKDLFTTKAKERAGLAEELQELVSDLGEEPINAGSIMGMIHRGWVDVKAAVADRSNSDIIAECENGEKAAMEAYSKALEESLPEEVRSVLEKHYEALKQSYNTVLDLENEYEEDPDGGTKEDSDENSEEEESS